MKIVHLFPLLPLKSPVLKDLQCFVSNILKMVSFPLSWYCITTLTHIYILHESTYLSSPLYKISTILISGVIGSNNVYYWEYDHTETFMQCHQIPH